MIGVFKFMLALALSIGMAALTPAGQAHAATDDTKAAIVDAAINNYIRPGYQRFHHAADTLAASIGTLCKTPSPAALNGARQHFAETVGAWSEIEFIQFGPVREQNRLERILFFPDRRGIGLRQVQALLAAADHDAINADKIASKSAALQGLPALEFILFGAKADGLATADASSKIAFRCHAGAIIAGNLATMAGEINMAWMEPQGFSALLQKPSGDNPLYANQDEALAAILKLLPNGYEMIAETRLRPILGDSLKQAKPKIAIWRRAGQTRQALMGNFLGLARLAEVSGLLEHVGENEAAFVPTNFAFEHKAALRYLGALVGPVDQAVMQPRGYDLLVLVKTEAQALRNLSTTGVLGGYGLTAGFSSLDGD